MFHRLIFGSNIAMMHKGMAGKDFIFFTEAWCFLGAARLMLLFRPFKKLLPILSKKQGQHTIADEETLQLIKLSIARAGIRSPWRTKCFEQALAAKMMLNRRGIKSTVYFGVMKGKDGDHLQAHAWVKVGEFVITGWKGIEQYSVVGIF